MPLTKQGKTKMIYTIKVYMTIKGEKKQVWSLSSYNILDIKKAEINLGENCTYTITTEC